MGVNQFDRVVIRRLWGEDLQWTAALGTEYNYIMEQPRNVKYITDENGQRQVVLPVETYEELLEDNQDLVAIAERAPEPLVPLDEILKKLKVDGLI